VANSLKITLLLEFLCKALFIVKAVYQSDLVLIKDKGKS